MRRRSCVEADACRAKFFDGKRHDGVRRSRWPLRSPHRYLYTTCTHGRHVSSESNIERRKAIQLGATIALAAGSALAGGCSDGGSSTPEPTGKSGTLPSLAERNYIFGYGSLIQRESRISTWPKAKEAAPAVVQGISRGWYDQVETASWGPTYLGAVPKNGSKCNGVVFSAAPEEISAFVERESGYRLTRIPPEDIAMLDGSRTPPAGAVWYFANVAQRYPSELFPIVQSYVDVCLDGCLEIEDSYSEARKAEFAKDFIRVTTDWRTPWLNDRIFPWRPFVHVPRANMIDSLIRDELGEALFNKITLPRR